MPATIHHRVAQSPRAPSYYGAPRRRGIFPERYLLLAWCSLFLGCKPNASPSQNERVEALLQGPNTIEAGLDALIAGGMPEEEAEERVARVFLRRLQEGRLTRSGKNLDDYEIELDIDRKDGLKMTYRIIPARPTPLPLS